MQKNGNVNKLLCCVVPGEYWPEVLTVCRPNTAKFEKIIGPIILFS